MFHLVAGATDMSIGWPPDFREEAAPDPGHQRHRPHCSNGDTELFGRLMIDVGHGMRRNCDASDMGTNLFPFPVPPPCLPAPMFGEFAFFFSFSEFSRQARLQTLLHVRLVGNG